MYKHSHKNERREMCFPPMHLNHVHTDLLTYTYADGLLLSSSGPPYAFLDSSCPHLQCVCVCVRVRVRVRACVCVCVATGEIMPLLSQSYHPGLSVDSELILFIIIALNTRV